MRFLGYYVGNRNFGLNKLEAEKYSKETNQPIYRSFYKI